MNTPLPTLRNSFNHCITLFLFISLMGYFLALQTSRAPGEKDDVVTITPPLAFSSITSAQRDFTKTLSIFDFVRLH